MIHGILQFTPSIAFRYVLHRCESQDIRCRESLKRSGGAPSRLRPIRFSVFLGADRAGGSFCFPAPPPPPGEGREEKGKEPGHHVFAGRSAGQVSTMILPQVHLRKPCYDFSFL